MRLFQNGQYILQILFANEPKLLNLDVSLDNLGNNTCCTLLWNPYVNVMWAAPHADTVKTLTAKRETVPRIHWLLRIAIGDKERAYHKRQRMGRNYEWIWMLRG